MQLSVLKKKKNWSAEQLSLTTEQISRDWSRACMNICAPETSPGVNFLLEESQLSVRNKREALIMLTSSTSDKRSSDLPVEAPKLGRTSPPSKPALKVNHNELARAPKSSRWFSLFQSSMTSKVCTCSHWGYWLGDVGGKCFECRSR